MDIKITNEAYLKLMYFIQECPTEVSGLGKVRQIDQETIVEEESYFSKKSRMIKTTEKMFEIYDLEVLPQKSSEAHSTIDEETLAEFLFDKTKKGEKVSDYKVWWHSHADMEAFFSGTDTGTIDGSTEFPYLISIVGNKNGDVKVRFDMHKPFRFTIDEENCRLKVGVFEDPKLREQCKKEIQKHVKQQRMYPVAGFRQPWKGGKDPLW